MITQPSSIPNTPTDRTLFHFRAQMARAHSAAELYAIPCCPLRPNTTVLHGGVVYAVTWLQVRFDSLSPTTVSSVRVVSYTTGRAVTFGQVIRKQRRSKKTGAVSIRYNSPAGNHSTVDEVHAALVALAAARLAGQEVAA